MSLDRSSPRLLPLPPGDWPDSVRHVLEAIRGDDGVLPNIFATFARHPALFSR